MWGGHGLFILPRPAKKEAGIADRCFDTYFEPRFKSLLTLLELTGASLHDEKIRGRGPTWRQQEREARHGLAGSRAPGRPFQ
jgi:hypothetical protein